LASAASTVHLTASEAWLHRVLRADQGRIGQERTGHFTRRRRLLTGESQLSAARDTSTESAEAMLELP
ncbi:MAG: hypothetical protein JWN54_1853, partial [Mycobacterium sp.]|nr:hypothetical protein [Mycobacterium sp.]